MFERFTCWDAADATRILRPLALEGNEAVFRATHSPIFGLEITGTEAHEVLRPTEEGLLATLSLPDRRHATCVVEGEAGSGKSHLIRWLKVNWPNGNDLPVLIERADGTLDGTLRQLSEKLGKEFGANIEAIVPRHKLTEQGQRGLLLLQLGNLCRSGTLSEPLGDEDWCEKHGLSAILQSEPVMRLWKAPERVLEVLTLGADRDSKVARFTARDVLDLQQPLMGLKGPIVGPGAIKLAQSLRTENQAIASALEGGFPGGDEPDISAVAPTATKFLAALNSRLSLAIQSVLGISGAALQRMFRDVRRNLKAAGRRLVLLLEDLTGAQGIDQELFYVLQERSTTQDHFCDIVSVIGITPAYFRQYIAPQANVVQRITHHVRFGEAAGSFQAVSALQEPSEQVAFASRYLRAVRAGMTEIDQAAQNNADVINRCLTCPHKEACHTAFGEVDGAGLYPLNANAIVRMFAALRDPKGAMFLQTPRALIQAVLAPSLSAEAAIRAGTFPVPSVETSWHPPSKRGVHGLADDLIEVAPEEQRERLRATVAWWGAGEIPAAGDASEHWAGVHNGVFQAFALPPPVSGGSQAEAPPQRRPEPVGAAPHQEPRQEPETASATEQPGSVGAPRAQKRTSPRTKIDEQFDRLRTWTKTGQIDDDGFWGNRAEAFIRQIAWKDEDVPSSFANEALGEVRLQGSGRTDHRNVVIPCEAWASRGLMWSARLEHGRVSVGEHEVAVQALGVFAQNVRRLVLKWISSRVPATTHGTPWEFGATVVQVLLVRAWLRGETHPLAPLVEQWQVILSDDSRVGAIRRPGAVAWSGVVENLAGDSSLHKRLRNMAECSEAVANVTFAAHAIRTLAQEARFTDFPTALPEQPIKTKWLSTLASSAAVARKALDDLPAREVGRLRERARFVLETAGTSDFAHYIARAALAFSSVRQGLPSHAPNALSEWFQQYASKESLLKAGPGSKHDDLRAFLEARFFDTLPDDSPIPVLLDLAILSPVESLEGIHGLVKDTAANVDSLVEYLSQHANVASSVQDAATVVEFGRRIEMKASELKRVLS